MSQLMFGEATIVSPVRTEPRTWLANERTFISWMHAATMLAIISTGLDHVVETPAMRMTGTLLALPAIAISIRALVLYYWRQHQLDNRSVGSYEDRIGPLLFVGLLTAMILANLFFALARHTVKQPPDAFTRWDLFNVDSATPNH